MSRSPALVADTSPSGAAEDHSISLGMANLIGLPLFLLLAAAVVVPYGLLWGWTRLYLAFNEFMDWQRFIPAIIVGTVVHEGLHGLGWTFFGRLASGAVRYGFNARTVTPYAHCTVPILASAYRKGTVLPGIVLGIIPAALGLAVQSGFFIMFAAFFLAAASGDFLCLWLMRSVSADAWVTDHPTRAGCVVARSPETGAGKPSA